MDEVERKDLPANNEGSASPLSMAKAKQVTSDTRSREAFELLKLGEAICSLQVDQRKMRLSVDDIRFERDRYKASAAAFQQKLTDALNENTRLRDLREFLKASSFEDESAAFYRNEVFRLTAILEDRDRQLQEANMLVDELNNKYNFILDELQESRKLAANMEYNEQNLVKNIEDMRNACVNLMKDVISEIEE